MGILDEAIREHLELKRSHGADDSELKQLEDQAFGPPERPGMPETALEGEAAVGDPAAPPTPDPTAEAPTEFMTQPDLGGDDEQPQRPPGAPGFGTGSIEERADPESVEESARPPASSRREPASGLADIQEAPEKPPVEEPAAKDEAPAAEEAPEAEEENEFVPAEEQSATEQEAISPAPVEHSTEERHVIADQPTQMFDVEEEFAQADAPAPGDEELVAEEMSEARLGPADPVSPPPEPAAALEEDDDDDFFDEKRLSEELDQALEAPIDREPEPVSDEHDVVPAHTDEHDAVGEPTQIHETIPEHTDEHDAVPAAHTDEHEVPSAGKRGRDEDVLEETPDFLEEAPEDDQLWFEQKPPKDFDFDD